jgi:hypothetical protein
LLCPQLLRKTAAAVFFAETAETETLSILLLSQIYAGFVGFGSVNMKFEIQSESLGREIASTRRKRRDIQGRSPFETHRTHPVFPNGSDANPNTPGSNLEWTAVPFSGTLGL